MIVRIVWDPDHSQFVYNHLVCMQFDPSFDLLGYATIKLHCTRLYQYLY